MAWSLSFVPRSHLPGIVFARKFNLNNSSLMCSNGQSNAPCSRAVRPSRTTFSECSNLEAVNHLHLFRKRLITAVKFNLDLLLDNLLPIYYLVVPYVKLLDFNRHSVVCTLYLDGLWLCSDRLLQVLIGH